MKEFNSQVKFIESYEIRSPIHPGQVKSKSIDIGIQDTNIPTP